MGKNDKVDADAEPKRWEESHHSLSPDSLRAFGYPPPSEPLSMAARTLRIRRVLAPWAVVCLLSLGMWPKDAAANPATKRPQKPKLPPAHRLSAQASVVASTPALRAAATAGTPPAASSTTPLLPTSYQTSAVTPLPLPPRNARCG